MRPGALRALTTMRLAAFVRTGRALAPTLAALTVLAVLYGGGRAQAAEAYAVSAVVLFPVLTWQTKLLLDAEPDVQRRLAVVAAGRRVDLAAGVLAGAVAALLAVLVALALPWPLGGIAGPGRPGEQPLGDQLAAGLWAHLVVLPPAVVIGALASRAVTRSVAYGVAVLALGAVGTLALGLRDSAVPWLVPPVMAAARAAGDAAVAPGADTAALLGVTGHTVAWTVAAFAGYAAVRRFRA